MAVRHLRTPQLEFGLLEAGSGPLALCLHGFPDTPHTWRHLLPALADAGFHAVAPFLRGYAPTEVPADGRYGVRLLADDAIALHEALGGGGDAVLIGHDWGAAAAYEAAAREPERWRRVVTLAIPPPPLDAGLLVDFEQMRRFFYMFLFQLPAAEEIVSANEFAFLDFLWEQWSPGYDASEDLAAVKECLREPVNLSAALGYYRALLSGHVGSGEPAPQPTLYLHGGQDGCVGIELVRDAARYMAAGSRMETAQRAGHFLHLELPDEIGKLILDWVSDG